MAVRVEPSSSQEAADHQVTRQDLLRWLWPGCEPDVAAVLYPVSGDKSRQGWIRGEQDVNRALKAFLAGTLPEEQFESFTKDGKHYSITGATGLGLVLHRDGQVSRIGLDLDDHGDDGGNVALLGPLARFFGADPVVFTSKGGKGLHAFFELAEPMDAKAFVRWVKAWGFNRKDQPELYPRSEKLSQIYLPGEPNDRGGDMYVSGSIDSAVVGVLPEPPTTDLTNTTIGFLRGEVTQPGRNDALNKAAYELGQKDEDRHLAWRLCERGARLCGLEPGEIQSTFKSGYSSGLAQAGMPRQSGAEHPITRRDYDLDGIGHGERFARMHRASVRYCVQESAWYTYQTTCWRRSDISAQAMAKEAARAIPDQAAKRKACTKTGVREILYLAASEPGMSVSATAFDGDPMLFNCRSGTIELRTGTIRKHSPADLLRKVSPVRYTPDSHCPRWLAFLDTVFAGDAELIAYIQRVCGYLLTGDVGEQCLFFLFGDGCNGKSVFCSLVQHVLGDYAIRVPAELIMKPPRGAGTGPTPDAVRLLGARLAVTSELEDGHRLAEAHVKDLTGGDRQVARPLYGNPIEFDPTHKLLLYGNHKPEIRNVDHGIWRRIRLIPFTVTIPDDQRDPELLDKLRAEAGAIFAWMVEGCLSWQRDGLGLPSAVRRATEDFRGESDQLGRFLEECCVLAKEAETPKGVIGKRYRAWCEGVGERPLSLKALHPRMEAHGLRDGRKKHARTWIGVKLREDDA